jgi:hypothetical protein
VQEEAEDSQQQIKGTRGSSMGRVPVSSRRVRERVGGVAAAS